MPGLADIPGTRTQHMNIPAEATAGSTDVWSVFRVDGNITVTAVTWIPDAAVTGDDTNNFTLALKNGATAITATKTYGTGTNSVANTAETLTLSSTAANLNAVAGDIITLSRGKTGNGLASPRGVLAVQYKFR